MLRRQISSSRVLAEPSGGQCRETLHKEMKRYASIALGVVLVLMLANTAAAKDYPLQIKVLSAESRQTVGPSTKAMQGCSWRDIDAYCFGESNYVLNIMRVQENNGQTLTLECTAYRGSHCTELPVDQTFPARLDKWGIEIRFTDKHGKQRTALYEIAGGDEQATE